MVKMSGLIHAMECHKRTEIKFVEVTWIFVQIK